MNSDNIWDNFLNKVGEVVNKNRKKVSKKSTKGLSDDPIRKMDFRSLNKKVKILLKQKKRVPAVETQRVIGETKLFEEASRQYKYDFEKYFSANMIDTSGRTVTDVTSGMLKILSERKDLDEEQREAIEKYCGNRRTVKPSFKCHLGGKTFTCSDDLKNHKKDVHDQSKKYQCCGVNFENYSQLSQHNKKKHAKRTAVKCPQCEKVFQSQASYFSHKNSVHNKVTCSICSKVISGKSNLRRHIRQVHTDVKPYKCDECNQTFGDRGNLKRHEKSKHLKLRDQCPQCEITCTVGTLQRHIRAFHKVEVYQCEDCSLDFRSKYGLSSHINKAHREVPIEYVCEICRQGGFFSPQDKSIHKKKFHKDERGERKTEKPKFECEKCPEIFSKRLERNRHMKETHKIEPNLHTFKCESCPKKFMTEKRLKRHQTNYCPNQTGTGSQS